jgi:hypothetical protein
MATVTWKRKQVERKRRPIYYIMKPNQGWTASIIDVRLMEIF